MTVRAEGLQIRRIVVSLTTIAVIDVELARMLGDESAPLTSLRQVHSIGLLLPRSETPARVVSLSCPCFPNALRHLQYTRSPSRCRKLTRTGPQTEQTAVLAFGSHSESRCHLREGFSNIRSIIAIVRWPARRNERFLRSQYQGARPRSGVGPCRWGREKEKEFLVDLVAGARSHSAEQSRRALWARSRPKGRCTCFRAGSFPCAGCTRRALTLYSPTASVSVHVSARLLGIVIVELPLVGRELDVVGRGAAT